MDATNREQEKKNNPTRRSLAFIRGFLPESFPAERAAQGFVGIEAAGRWRFSGLGSAPLPFLGRCAGLRGFGSDQAGDASIREPQGFVVPYQQIRRAEGGEALQEVDDLQHGRALEELRGGHVHPEPVGIGVELIGPVADVVTIPEDHDGVRALLDSLLLEKALYEVMYELNNRPDWLGVPLKGVLSLVSPE